jgi:TRAP-type C4-dicarboxylate transport system permease small subunit
MSVLLLISRFKRGMETLIDWIAVSAFIVIFFAAMAQIVMRWVFRNPLVWSEELIRLMFVWICYIGWTIAARNRSHICITAILSRLPPPAGKILETFNCLLLIAFSIFMIRYGIKMTEVGSRSMSVTLPINFAVVYISVPITNSIILFYQILTIAGMWKKPEGALP